STAGLLRVGSVTYSDSARAMNGSRGSTRISTFASALPIRIRAIDEPAGSGQSIRNSHRPPAATVEVIERLPIVSVAVVPGGATVVPLIRTGDAVRMKMSAAISCMGPHHTRLRLPDALGT